MQNSLGLKDFEVPNTLPEAQGMCRDLAEELQKMHEHYKQRFEFLKQRYITALRLARPGLIAEASLKDLFDEVELTADPDEAIEIEEESDSTNNKGKKRKKKRKAIPDHLPRTVIEHDVNEQEKLCAQDGTALTPMGFDVREELKYSPAKFEVIEHRYPKYSCKSCQEGVIRQAVEPRLIPQSYASAELLAEIACSKYCNHLPLYRQEQIFGRDGVHITRQVMADWMIKLGEALNPLIDLMHRKILESTVVCADETPVKMLTKDGVRTSTLSYMWQISRWGPKPLVIFEHDPSRKKEVAERLLGSYAGYVQIDGYAGYNLLFTEGSPRKRIGCMAHCYRKFREFLKSLKKEERKSHPALKAIGLIKQLYEIEESCRGLQPEDRKVSRLRQEAPRIFTELQEYVALEKESISTSSPYFDALRYAHTELPHIRLYLEHGAIEIDNNFAENAIRPFALGRRNWLFICAKRGAKASANIYSVLITAKANGIEPRAYLTKIIKQLPHCHSAAEFEALLPT